MAEAGVALQRANDSPVYVVQVIILTHIFAIT
jgi:hypothetical protein